MTDKNKAIEELKKLMAEQKARIDPAVLERAVAAASAKKPTTPSSVPPPPASVPYDKEAAAMAVELFLKSHGNADDFSKKLLQFMKKNSQ